jgi:putative transposase
MTDRKQNATKNRQKSAVSTSDLFAQRSEVDDAEEKITSDHGETVENTGLDQHSELPKSPNFCLAGSEVNRVFLSPGNAAKLTGITDRGIRDNAAAGKYPGAHKITGNGGEGWAIPLDTLPAVAQAMYFHEQFTAAGLTADLFPSGSTFSPEDREDHWKRYDESTEKCQARARDAFAALLRFNELLRAGTKKMDAYATIKAEFEVARSTFNEWQQAVDGLDQSDWLPALTPDLSGRTNAKRTEWPGRSWLHFLKGALTPGADVATAYNRTKREAEAQCWGQLPSLSTARNDLKFSVDRDVATLIKEGPTSLKRLSPTVERDYEAYRLHELWSMDGRRLDLMVRDTKGEFGPKGRIFRMWLYGVQEVRSRYFVGYSLGQELNADAVRDALVTAFNKTGLIRPETVQVDNGMEAAAKEITGGASWRRRGKVKEDEIIGLLPFLNIAVSWATPAHGQTKPIERQFGTLAGMLEKRPEFRGAYCGHKPEARPEEWDAAKAAPIELVRKLLAEEIEAYHRNPHRGHGMNGKSPMAVYTELMNSTGYVPKVISQRQFRRCVLSAIPVTIRQDGSFTIHGARYYSEATARLPRVRGYYACYNRHDLNEPVTLYLGIKIKAEAVPQIERTPGNCKESAKKIMKARRDFTKATKARAKALFDIQAADGPAEIAKRIAAKHPELIDTETGEILPVGKVVELTRPTAETSYERSQEEIDHAAKIKAMADEIDQMMVANGPQRSGKR